MIGRHGRPYDRVIFEFKIRDDDPARKYDPILTHVLEVRCIVTNIKLFRSWGEFVAHFSQLVERPVGEVKVFGSSTRNVISNCGEGRVLLT